MSPAPDRADSWSFDDRDPGGVALVFGGETDTGPVRAVNEDGWLASPPVFVVADGMGGHAAGDLASAIVISRFAELSTKHPIGSADVERTIEQCRAAITALAVDGEAQPGSTLISATLVPQGDRPYWLIANIGDSRAYLLADGELDQLSRDHSVVQELIDAGEITPADAESHRDRHVITRALGALEESPADYSLIPVEAGNRLLLCTDGVSGVLAAGEIARILGAGDEPQAAADALVAAALAAGGKDNATALVVLVLGSEGEIEVATGGTRVMAGGPRHD